MTLYSFRRCPYAIRARLALAHSGIEYELREVVLKNKPQAMLSASDKGTVPVLVMENGEVLDESLDIMYWALEQSSSEQWLESKNLAASLIEQNDGEFKYYLDRYKYFDRYPENSQADYLKSAMQFVQKLEQKLQLNTFLLADHITMADAAIFPFIRQFAFVDKNAFDKLPLPKVQAWLEVWLNNPLFIAVMPKYTPWQDGDQPLLIMYK